MNRYAVLKEGTTCKLIESQDNGRTWIPYPLSPTSAFPIADALNAWHSEGAVESLSAALDALTEGK